MLNLKQISNFFKTLSEPIRLRMLILLNKQELCVCDLENALKISQPLVSQHLNKLKNANLINEKKVGKWKHYYLSKFGKNILNLTCFNILSKIESNAIIFKDKKNLIKYQKQKIRKC
ncbi:MAG TPA: metalloregulator ArsR/SmtB family transcription factor [bacterium]|nr:metalloregulator ArsR/SmtB family transcription factor [bacterium]HPQ19564.1 metalloregulator ArsR/SmtB family transcription factor [bacterium]